MGFFFNPFSHFMINFIPVIVTIGFIGVFLIIILIAVKCLLEWSKNNNSPVIIVPAVVVSKREKTSHYNNNDINGMNNVNHVNHSYYITFELESRDRIELKVSEKNYGYIAQNDRGNLKFQGTRFLDFERII